MSTHMTQEADKVGTPAGVVWKPKFIHHTPRSRKAKKPATLAEMNVRLAASRHSRMDAAEENCIKIVGRTRL